GIEHEHGTPEPTDDRRPPERNQTGKAGDRQIAPVADRRRRHRGDQQVARDAADIARHERQHQYAEQIKPALDPCRRSAQREYESADKIEHQQERVHRAFLRIVTRSYVIRPHDLVSCAAMSYAASQARAATTIASTPVCSVGWMTGAKRGLWLV